MKFLQKHWFISLVVLVIVVIVVSELLFNNFHKKNPAAEPLIPDIKTLSNSENDNLVKYGRELIINTGRYFGPKGSIAHITNGINCGSCHMDAGTKLYTGNFLLVASTYPKFRERSGRIESVEFRVNECMQRSLSGQPIDSTGKEMKALVAYLKWVGKNTGKDKNIEGAASEELPYLSRAADTLKGKSVYSINCQSCHAQNGDGILNNDSATYRYPPVWGENSYAVSAGMYRLTKLAAYIKNNMPVGATHQHPMLTNEEAWDVAAFINSKYHPQKMFAYDWPVLSTKPVDYPFGPYTDRFSESQHKYGPFAPIKSAKGK